MGRRVQKRVVDVTQNQEISARRFLYDGWNLVAEYAAPGGTTCGALLRSYTWGLDIVNTMASAGGVGALLQIADHPTGKTFLPTYDGNGNIAALLNAASGALAAAYEYSPYGEPLRAQTFDPVVADNPFRFSTKFTDVETGLVYYGRRYYSPSQGRFLGRDTKQEKGGLNLYGFCRNNSINMWDVLGEEPDHEPTIYGETATVLEDVGNGQQRYVTYRAVYLGEYSRRENGSDDNNLMWVVDSSGNRDAPTRGMPENGSPSFQVGGVTSPSIVIAASTLTPARIYKITFRVGFDSSVTDTTTALAGFNAQIATMQALFNSNGLGSILLDYDHTGVTPTAPTSYDFSDDGSPAVVSNILTQCAQVGRLPGVIPVLLTNTPFINAAVGTVGVGYQNTGIIMKVGAPLATLAHETGHVVGYVREGGNPASKTDRHSPDPSNLMYEYSRPDQNILDLIYKNSIWDYAVPIPKG